MSQIDQNLNEGKRKLVKKSALRVIKLADIQFDESYQRSVKPKHKRIIADFKEEALGIPLVAEREDGSLWGVDGQQRITALKKMSKETVRAEVFHSKGPEHEAEVYCLVNIQRTKPTACEEFRGLLTAQNKDAWEIKDAVEKEGFIIASGRSGYRPNSNWKQISGINALRSIHKNQGVEAITFVLTVAKECWPEDKMAVNSRMMMGLARWWISLDAIDMERLIPRFRKTTPHKILYAANQQNVVGEMIQPVVNILDKLYNSRLRKE